MSSLHFVPEDVPLFWYEDLVYLWCFDGDVVVYPSCICDVMLMFRYLRWGGCGIRMGSCRGVF